MISFIEAYSGNKPDWVVRAPSWPDVVDMLEALDGSEYSLLTMGADSENPPWLQLGGGDGGLVMCQYMWDVLDGFKVLCNPTGSVRDKVSLTVGGQTGDNWTMDGVHTKDAVVEVVRYYFDHCEMHPDYEWT